MKIWIKIISVLQIIGGVCGIVIGLVLTYLGRTSADIVAVVAFGINILSLVAGIALWRGRKSGRTTSIIVQAIQLLKIISPPVIFNFSFGLDIWVHFLFFGGPTDVGLNYAILAHSALSFKNSVEPSGFGISIISCVFLPLLLSYKPMPTHSGGITASAAT